MKHLVLIAMLAASLACGSAKADSEANKGVEVGVRDTVIAQCETVTNDLRAENDKLKTEAVEKDKKITWLRKKAKDAGADLTK